MTLQEQLDQRRTERRARLSPGDNRILNDALERLRMLQLAEHGLQPGDPFPELALADAQGYVVRSEALLARGPLVVVFFRGGWCPYCDLAFRALEGVRPELEALGAALIGIVAERPEVLARTAAEKGVRFPLLVDEAGRLAALCGLRFEMSEAHAALYMRLGVELPALQAGLGWELPIPASFVVAQDATIVHAFTDPDFTRRADPADLVRAVRTLGAKEKAGGDDRAEGLIAGG